MELCDWMFPTMVSNLDFLSSLGQQRSPFSLLCEAEAAPVPGSTRTGFTPKVSASSSSSKAANCSLPNHPHPNMRIFEVQNLHQKCTPAPGPKLLLSPAPGSAKLGQLSQHGSRSPAQTVTTVQVPRAVLSLSPPSPEIQ